MRSRFLVCAALAGFALANGRSLVAHAADAKAKGAKKKSDDASEDKTGIGKTLQWEDKVMGPDDKKSELDKIRRAQEINKAAAEKAERERAANAAREAKEKDAAAKAGPTTQKRGGEVALPALPDEGPSGGQGKAKHTDVSPKLDTAAAAAPPPVLKPADDKFIDKLLKEESGSKRKKASASEDKALIDMLATEKPAKATGKKGKKDGVDDLIDDAEKSGPMPERKIKHETPEWAKPEIRESVPAPAMVATPKPMKRDDGVIHVVQGAAGTSPPAGSARPAVATTTRSSAPAGSGTRKQTAAINSRPGEWADPFSDPPSRKTAGKQVASAKRSAVDDDDDFRPTRRAAAAPPPPAKREAASRGSNSDWNDPFSDPDRKTTGTRRAAPAETTKPAKAAPVRGKGGKWDDPFTSNDDGPAAKKEKPKATAAARPVVATREPAAKQTKKVAATPPAPAQHRVVAVAAPAAESPAKAPAQGRWGILKKRR